VNPFSYFLIAGSIGAALALRADLRRRRLALTRRSGWSVLTALDVAPVAVMAWITTVWLFALLTIGASEGMPVPSLLAIFATVAIAGILMFLWIEGRRQVQFQRPRGIVFGEFLILMGALYLGGSLFSEGAGAPRAMPVVLLCTLAIISGATLIAIIVPRYLKKGEERAILERLVQQGESIQPESTAATPECPHPQRWRMVDTQSTELEVLGFLKSIVTTIKPNLIVETGTFLGHGTLKMAEGLKENGFGRIITIEYDPVIFAKAKERIDASGLGDWIEYRNTSSLDTKIDGTIDILYSDSALAIREQEIRRFLPQIEPRGLIMIHDASSHFEIVRQAALRLEQEGLLSVVLLPTPRGLVVAQKREGRK
jgi:predicted O-methyltransferase YrrM